MKPSQKIQRKTWYGLTATVIIGPGFMHIAGWGAFLIPHPPMANWLLRFGVSEKNRETLAHEFEHLQSAPVLLLFAVILTVLAFTRMRAGFAEMILIFIGSHTVWEMVSETLTFYKDRQLYRRCYEKVSALPRMAFWFFAVAAAITAGLFVLL